MTYMTQVDMQRKELLAEIFDQGSADAELSGRFLRTHEVALLFDVSNRAVTTWASQGKISTIRTPGGHRRYPMNEVRKLLEESGYNAHT
jgi:excisionase family DNA binding protein